jgi:hypothetical protein
LFVQKYFQRPIIFVTELFVTYLGPLLPSVYGVQKHYIWDNWILEDNGTMYRYALSAPTETDGKHIVPNQRHWHAFIRYAVSTDGGKSWEDRGPLITAELRSNWPDLVIWTSSIFRNPNQNSDRPFFMFITGVNRAGIVKNSNGDVKNAEQKIGVAFLSNPYTFTEDIALLSSPTHEFNPDWELNYDTTTDDGIIMAWRDPCLMWDPPSQKWHMFFSAKAKTSKDGEIRVFPTAGHMVATDYTPILLPQADSL